LENVILQGILFSTQHEIKPQDVGIKKEARSSVMAANSIIEERPYKIAKEEIIKQFNNQYIRHYLKICEGNVTHAAKLCGLERQALQQIMRRYNIKADPFRS
jgi:DNA-binding NtrC family response regulator